MAALEKAIETQEELDEIITKRLAREQEKFKKEREDALAEYEKKTQEYEKQIAGFAEKAKETESKDAETQKTIAELQSRVKGFETSALKTKISHEMGIPFELASRLSGDDEKAIRADAENLSKILGTQKHKSAPARSSENGSGDGDVKTAAYASILGDFRGE